MSDQTPKSWQDQANAIAGKGGERSGSYGRPLINFLRIALRWSNWLKIKVTPKDVAVMNIDTKLARLQHDFRDDSPIDIFGYMRCWDDINQHMKELGFPDGGEHFKNMSIADMQNLLEILEGRSWLDTASLGGVDWNMNEWTPPPTNSNTK